MTLRKHLDESVARMKEASARIEEARARPTSLEMMREWLAALSDFCVALSDVQSFNSESIHEKLHELAERTHVNTVSPAGRARRAAE
jgi:hypothetical protein